MPDPALTHRATGKVAPGWRISHWQVWVSHNNIQLQLTPDNRVGRELGKILREELAVGSYALRRKPKDMIPNSTS